MKKLLLSLLFVLPLCGFAQKGMQGVGMNLGLGFTFDDVEFAINPHLNYQKHLSNRFRLSCSLGLYSACYYHYDYSYSEYWGGREYEYRYYGETFYCLIAADVHYFFNQPRRLRPYAIGGILFGVGDGDGYFSNVVGGVKLGLGLTYRLGYHWAMNLETPLYFGGFLPTLGLTYTF